MNSAGGTISPNYPFFITQEPTLVKEIWVPSGTKLTYEEHFWKEGQQTKPLSEKKITLITLPENEFIYWGGIPVYEIEKYFNPEMRGFTVYADFDKIDTLKLNEFGKIWKSCSNQIGININNIDDWSFKTKNITDIANCGSIQRFFKDDIEQQEFLNKLYLALQKNNL